MNEELRTLYDNYLETLPGAERLRAALRDQLENMVSDGGLKLGVPIEHRIKTWDSVSEKIRRRSLQLKRASDLHDLIGIRLILLFNRDVEKACTLIRGAFRILETEDTSERLAEAQFGYRSHHLVVRLPRKWLSVPSFKGLGDLRAEIQVRSLAQHIWAAAQHVLQYKHEESVPPPIRRSIYRVSALLETVDLEFERLLDDRSAYIAAVDVKGAEPLNVDVIRKVLDAALPPQNKGQAEPYADLLPDLLAFDINTANKLQLLVARRLTDALKDDAKEVARRLSEKDYGDDRPRLETGVFYIHVGLGRMMLQAEFGKKWRDYSLAKAMADHARRSPPAVAPKAAKAGSARRRAT